MNPRLIDTHTHVQFPVYSNDRNVVIQNALDAGIWMVNIGTQESTSRDAIELAEKYPAGVFASAGFHPGHIEPQFHDAWEKEHEKREIFHLETFRELAMYPKVVGVGECGLDYYRIMNHEPRIMDQQKEVFIKQIELAKELRKPLIIHCRDAFADLVRILDSYFIIPDSRPAGVIHFFSGTLEDAAHLMRLGFYLGFGGVVTFAKEYKKIIHEVPLERIVLETDAPYVAPAPYRGKRNEPLYMEAVAAKIAEWKGISIDEVMVETTRNAKNLFRI